LLIRNDCKHRWRGRYNEDTDICLRVMKDGDVCVQLNAFLQGKAATQTVKGGNTAEFYHAENIENETFKETGYNTEGTVNKSQMLVDMHPDVA
jgi:predicted O-methyltransferase YrrM